jgi:hypothetical protein
MYDDFKRDSEDVVIRLKRYRIDGFPVCVSWYGSSDQNYQGCLMAGTKNFGTQTCCLLLCVNTYTYKKDSLTIPDKKCPLWDYEKDIKPLL